ncbi:MAG: type III pantothenate kinase [Alphaproteobacteria bacterium]
MLLAIDVGNTNTVFALITEEEGAIIESWRLKTLNDRTADEYAAFFFGLSKDHHLDKSIKGIIVSSVVPEANFHLRSFFEKYLSIEPLFVAHDNAGVAIGIESPEDIGADRLVNTRAVKEYYNRAAIVLDFGTATTFDVIDAQGVYKGGVIAPGINLSLSALSQAASKLPKISIRKPEKTVGTTTISAMQAGIYYGYVGLIKEIIALISQEAENKPIVIATGGLATIFEKDIEAIELIDHNLTLKGLYCIYKAQKLRN